METNFDEQAAGQPAEPANTVPSSQPRESVRRTYLWLFGTLIVLVLVQLILSLRRDGFEKEISQRQHQRYESRVIADLLRQSSDELTRMARTYAATGNPAYEQYYQDILAIRDGLKPRPDDYGKVYWDRVIAGGRQPATTNRPVALESMMAAGAFTEPERALLRESKRSSDALVELEQLAMNAVKGVYRDAAGQFSLRGQPNPAYAITTLHGDEYHLKKARIMAPIREFQILLDQRTQAGIRYLQQRARFNASLEMGVSIAAVLLVVWAFLRLNRKIIEPLARLTASATAVGRHGFFRRVIVESDDELGALAGALNRMSETVEQKIAETEGKEERFRCLIEAAPDALVIADEAGNITLINRQTESLLGYTREELIGQPVTLLVPACEATEPPTTREAPTGRVLAARRKDGSELPVEISRSPITGSDGCRLVCSAIRDVSGRQAAEAQIARQLAFQLALLDTIPYPMFVKDPHARFLGCNRAYEEAFGVSREFLAGRTVLELPFLPEDARSRFHAEDPSAVCATMISRSLSRMSLGTSSPVT
jgi:PAS domain S-box-containing protein